MSKLICMRLADMVRVHPRQRDDLVCEQCGERLGIYPSGQEAMKREPDLVLICSVCAEKEGADSSFLAPGAEREPFESAWKKT